MSQTDKLIQSFLCHPIEIQFKKVKSILMVFGFEKVRSKGSHYTFRHKDGRIQVVPKKKGQKVRGIYIKQIIKLLRLEESYVQEKEN